MTMPASPVIGAGVCTREKADFTPAAPRVGATKAGRTADREPVVMVNMSQLLHKCRGALGARRSGDQRRTPGVSRGANDLMASSAENFAGCREPRPKPPFRLAAAGPTPGRRRADAGQA